MDEKTAWWLLLTAKDTPDAVALQWAERARATLAPSAPGWDTVVVTASADWKQNCESHGGKPDWRGWSEGVPRRYGGLVVPVEGDKAIVGRATSDILEAAAAVEPAPHLVGFDVGRGTIHALLRVEPNWVGDERPWKAWSRLVLGGWPPSGQLVRAAGPAKQPPAEGDTVADFLARCDEVMERAEEVLGNHRAPAAADFLAGIGEKIGGMRDWARGHNHVTDRMAQAVENIDSGVGKWQR